jgi:TonB-linked SusC/RagA family outer membrane protein
MFGNRNVLSTLKNIDPSFNIMADNVFGSDPNRLPEINMRGNSSLPSVSDLRSDTRANLNSPLIILDGFEISLQKMIDLNDDEVKSITLLKDASATAIYGSRGANGVVVITTKQPEEGKLKITAKSTINVELADLSSYDVLNAREKLDLELKSGLYTATDFLSKDVILKKLYNQNLTSVEKGNDTDWMSKPLRTGVGQRHNFKIEGGDSKMRYSASVDYNHVAGVMKKSNRKNMNGMVTLAYYHKNLTFRNQLSVGINKSEQSPYGSFNTYVRLNPYWTPYDEEGNLIKIFDRTKPFWGSSFPSNPLYNATLNTVNSSEYTDIINNFSLEWEPTKDIILRGQLGLLKETNSSDLFKPASHTQFDLYKEDDLFRKGSYIYGSGEKFNYDMSFTFNYNKVFAGSHQIYLGLDYSMTEKTEENYSFFIEGFSNDNQSFLPLGLSYQKDGKPSGFENTTRRVGFTSNMNYVYDNRYFVDASYRVDGSSQFGSEKRFAPFWSAGIGWNIHEEDFLTDSGIINRLRLKGSFGTTGSQNFPAYQAARTYNYDYNDRYLNWTGANLLGLGNENLEWQITKQYNVGIESALFNTRVKLSADAYYKTTSNLLSEMDLPLSSGFSSYTENVGEVENKGFELMASAFLIRDTQRELIWSVTGRLVHNKSEIIKLSEAIKSQNELVKLRKVTNPNQLFYEGDPIDAIYVVPSLGIDPSTGKELFLNKDGEVTSVWDPEDRVFAGVATPKFRGNLSSMFRYKNFNLNASFAYQWGGQY